MVLAGALVCLFAPLNCNDHGCLLKRFCFYKTDAPLSTTRLVCRGFRVTLRVKRLYPFIPIPADHTPHFYGNQDLFAT